MISFVSANAVRLVGGRNSREGRVEVYHNGAWGTVCDDSWDADDAEVVCRQLGFPLGVGRGETVAYGSAHFGQGSGNIWLDDVACTGYESFLSQCSHARWEEENCNHFEDAGVVCGKCTKSFIIILGVRSSKFLSVINSLVLIDRIIQ